MKIFYPFAVLFIVMGTTGCGGHSGGLATDNSDITLDEYQKMQDEAQAKMNAEMQEAATKK